MNLNFIMIHIVKQFLEHVKLDFTSTRYIISNSSQLLKLFQIQLFYLFCLRGFFWPFWIGLGVNTCRNEKEILLSLQYKGFNRPAYIVHTSKYLQNYYFTGKFRLICQSELLVLSHLYSSAAKCGGITLTEMSVTSVLQISLHVVITDIQLGFGGYTCVPAYTKLLLLLITSVHADKFSNACMLASE